MSHSDLPQTGRRFREAIPRKIRVICVMGILSVIAFLQLTSIREEVQTIDEGVHLTAGVSYWLTGDYRMNEEHPPLVKLLAALPVVFAQPTIDWNSPSWQEGNQWAFARDVLYEWGNDADFLLFLGRLPMIGITLLLGFVLYLWGRRIAGDWAGLMTLAWFALDPNFLAHGRYITTDVPITLGYAATLYALARLQDGWTRKRMLVFGGIFGLTQVTKFSALPLFLLVTLAPLLWHRSQHPFRATVKRMATVLGLAIAGTALAVTVVYGFQVRQGGEDPWVQALYQERQTVLAEQRADQQPPAVQKIISLTDPTSGVGRFLEKLILHTPIPSWSYFKGIALVINHDYWGHLAYLRGAFSNFGWWWYFPYAILIKTPFATLIVTVLALVALFRTRLLPTKYDTRALALVAGTAIFYLLWSMTSNLNLGLRHVYPVYVGIFILCGVFLASAFASPSPWFRRVVLAIGLLYAISSMSSYPTYTAYFSEIIGGSKNGPTHLVDSNIDWGQDVKRLRSYLRQENIPYVCMSYFGQASLRYYGIDHRYLPTTADPHTPQDIQCVVAISVTSLLSQDGAYSWLRGYTPDERIGGSIYLYDFRNSRRPGVAQELRN